MQTPCLYLVADYYTANSMHKFFSTLSAIVLTSTCLHVSAQISVDKDMKRKYDSAYASLPEDAKSYVTDANDKLLKLYNEDKKSNKTTDAFQPMAFAVVVENAIDTLNKEDLAAVSFKYNKKNPPLFMADAAFRSDSFAIVISPLVPDDMQIDILHLIKDGHLSTSYFEWHLLDTLFRNNLKDKPNNLLELKAASSTLKVNDDQFKINKPLYGYVEIVTQPFYETNMFFKKGYIHKRLRFKYYFKVVPHKSAPGEE
jgi:hypothetical protein